MCLGVLALLFSVTLLSHIYWNMWLKKAERFWEKEVVTILKVPIKVICFGGVTPSKLLKNPGSKPEKLILVIPGNPGLTSFYITFAEKLHKHTQLPLWIVSHGGHENLPVPSLENHQDLYTLEGQCRQKQELIETYLKGVQLQCVAHSIGSYMVLDLLQTACNDQIQKAYLLFPAIERLANTVNGRKLIFVLNYIKWAPLGLASFVQLLPRPVQNTIALIYCWVTSATPDNKQAVVDILEPKGLNQIFFLGENQMKTVLERNNDAIERSLKKIRFYYGATDGWTPLNYVEELKRKFPEVQAEVDTEGILHSFTLMSSIKVAEMVSSWIITDMHRI